MNIAPEHEAEFNEWYDKEHIPALAAVPGVLCARRFRGTRQPQVRGALPPRDARGAGVGRVEAGAPERLDEPPAATFPRSPAPGLPALRSRRLARRRFARGASHDSRALQGSGEGPGLRLRGGAAAHRDADLREARAHAGGRRRGRRRADDDRPARRRDARRVEHAARLRPRLQGGQARSATRAGGSCASRRPRR